MRRMLSHVLAAVLAVGAFSPAVFGAETPVVSPLATPEAAILLPAKVLRGNDFKSFYQLMPAADKAAAETQWKTAQAQAKTGANADQLSEANQMLGKLLAPDAVETMMKETEPKLADLKVQELSQQLQMVAGILPMLLGQPTPGQTPEQAQGKQALSAMLQGMLTDASSWVLTSGINDPKKLRSAIEHLVTGAKLLGVKNVEELQALSFEDFLGRLGPLVKEAKASAEVYDIGIDKFLDSIKAEAVPPAAGTPDTMRTLNVSFTSFGKPYTFPVQVEKKDNAWIISPKNGEQFGAMKQMMGGPGGM